MMAVSLNWDSIYIIQLQSMSPKKICLTKRMSNGCTLLHRLNQQSTHKKHGENSSYVKDEVFSDHRSTLAHDVVPVPQHRCRSTGARCSNLTGRLGDIAWFLLDHIDIGNPGCHKATTKKKTKMGMVLIPSKWWWIGERGDVGRLHLGMSPWWMEKGKHEGVPITVLPW